MLTFFSTPKPFRGHAGVIQRNALRSWKLVHPDAEVILFGDEEGAADAARELGLRHVPQVQLNEHGTKYLSPIFDRAQEIARHDLLCYVNCDILLMADFRQAVERVSRLRQAFLMVGRRWDTDITEAWDFSGADWAKRLRDFALLHGKQRPQQWIDYFVFSRGLFYKNMPAFVIGRPGWDNWLVGQARASKARVVDASPVVVAVHQNHDYSYHPDGEEGVWRGEEARRNYELLGGWFNIFTVENATHRLTPAGMQRNPGRWFTPVKRFARGYANWVWIRLLRMTRPMRHRLGLRQQTLSGFLAKEKITSQPARGTQARAE